MNSRFRNFYQPAHTTACLPVLHLFSGPKWVFHLAVATHTTACLPLLHLFSGPKWVFRLAVATRCLVKREIWHGEWTAANLYNVTNKFWRLWGCKPTFLKPQQLNLA